MFDALSPPIEKIYNSTFALGHRAVAFTGAEHDVGVTSIATALAQRCANGGKSTLLVDMTGAAAQPEHSSWFEPGDGSASQAVEVHELGFDVLKVVPNNKSIFAFRSVQKLLALLKLDLARYDAIIVDTAPASDLIQAAIPACISAAACDCVVLILPSETMTKAIIDQRCADLRFAGARINGIVVNRRDSNTLAAEIAREMRRFERVLPRISRWLQSAALNSPLLSTIE